MKTSPTDTNCASTANAGEEALVERRASTRNVLKDRSVFIIGRRQVINGAGHRTRGAAGRWIVLAEVAVWGNAE
jgi:hypothetical protein